MQVVIEDYTDSHGKMETLDLRAGTRVMVKVLEAPFYHLAPRYAPNGSDSLAFRITGTHHCEMFLPRKPRIKVFVYDCTSGEEVQGIKFRVLVDRNLSRASQVALGETPVCPPSLACVSMERRAPWTSSDVH